MPSLPDSWIDRIFDKLTLTYGKAFMAQYEGLAIDLVKANWAHELSGYQNHAESIKFALVNLPPERPPNVLQFRAMCRRSPPPVFKALPSPPADPERVKAELAKIRSLFTITTKAAP